MYRFYVERRVSFDAEAKRIKNEINGFLNVHTVRSVRYLNRYDVENASGETAKECATRVFSEPQSDSVYETLQIHDGEVPIIWEYLPGQYDQRADSAEQCILLLREGLKDSIKTETARPIVRCAKIVLLTGNIAAEDIEKIKHYLINEVDSRLTDDKMPETLAMTANEIDDIKIVTGFITKSDEELSRYRGKMGLAMDDSDLRFLRDYFKGKGRDPTETEVRVLDTYWSDHCRHTTFLTELESIEIEDGPYKDLIRGGYDEYKNIRNELYGGRKDKCVTLMDMAVIGAKYLRAHGMLDDLEVSDENNACSVYIDVDNGEDGGLASVQKWILMFKNETHNHPTEIEPFGGAATCIGGAIRDPLSGRAWVYQAMRVTGAANPTLPLEQTIKGKLPQIKLCRESAQGFSSYGNQIGLATGQVTEYYHPGYAAKRMELGAVIAAAPCDCVMRETPEAGDVVILLGGGTGRDGIGGATGSSKVHTLKSVETCAAEVQKGNAVEERKIQRLFRDKDVCRMIRRSNDFGAGGVAVAVGELSAGLDINLDAVPKKYAGLNGTELAISESQERMAAVVRSSDAKRFINKAAAENLNAVVAAKVTDTNRLVMRWRGKTIVDLDRAFLDAAGARHKAVAFIETPAPANCSPLTQPQISVRGVLEREYKNGNGQNKSDVSDTLKEAWLTNMSDLSCASDRGLSERFDGSIGAGSVLFPFGGKYQCTPEAGMAARIPVIAPQKTHTVSIMAHGFDPRVSQWSPWHGAQIAVLLSLAKIVCMGGDARKCRLSFQEFFGRAVDKKTWGYPAAALLGALDAQIKSGCAAIGGKDSMSGTFENINVPYTLVSFAVTTADERNITSGAFKKAGSNVYLITVPYSDELSPDWASFMQNSNALCRLNMAGKISAMYPICAGGLAEAVTKMAMGNGIGIKITTLPIAAARAHIESAVAAVPAMDDLFIPQYGAIAVEAAEEWSEDDMAQFANKTATFIGKTTAEAVIETDAALLMQSATPKAGGETKKTGEICGNIKCRIPIKEAVLAWEKTLSSVYPITSGAKIGVLPPFAVKVHESLGKAREALNAQSNHNKASISFSSPSAKPRVIIPVFPGTNCEYDTARAFINAGADVHTAVFTNRSSADIRKSLDALCKEIEEAQILSLAGGFSAGDEPDGSGKFIANVLRSPNVAEKVMDLLIKRKGLILGICNGFQALIKTGLLPYGEIRDMSTSTPTLTFNNIARHVSRVVRTRVLSAVSPWALDRTVLDAKVHLVPVSHGEGRMVMPLDMAKSLFENGQVFTQYVDENGNPAMMESDNPNGSVCAIEGLTSLDGRVLGKMGHSERTIGGGLIKNIPCQEGESIIEDIFSAGVRYFK